MQVVLVIFSIQLKYKLTDFANFFITWAYSHTKAEINFILKNLDWSPKCMLGQKIGTQLTLELTVGTVGINLKLSKLVTQHICSKFFGLFEHCKKLFQDSYRRPLKRSETENNLNTLQKLSINHSPSILGFLCFQIYI